MDPSASGPPSQWESPSPEDKHCMPKENVIFMDGEAQAALEGWSSYSYVACSRGERQDNRSCLDQYNSPLSLLPRLSFLLQNSGLDSRLSLCRTQRMRGKSGARFLLVPFLPGEKKVGGEWAFPFFLFPGNWNAFPFSFGLSSNGNGDGELGSLRPSVPWSPKSLSCLDSKFERGEVWGSEWS
jgi:hypothetical protein